MNYKPIIGLEIHAQLFTNTKAFCGCKAQTFDETPNTHICEVCTGQPGVLPILNKKVVEYAIRAALALHCKINLRSSFDRKNYFYPDLPKGYQITQYFRPIAEEGFLQILSRGRKKKIRIRRIHIEEDAGKMMHSKGSVLGRYHGQAFGSAESLLDFNRCGIPLIEIVTEPDIDYPDEAHDFMELLRNTLRAIGVCSGDMEKGAYRCDANISLKDADNHQVTARVEIKNVNSFRYVQKALEFEQQRLQTLLENNIPTFAETRGWDSVSRSTVLMRKKEEESDYRYFPEPDLPDLRLTQERIEEIKKTLPELPAEKYDRFIEAFGVSPTEAQTCINNPELGDFFETVQTLGSPPKMIIHWLVGEVQRILKEINRSIDHTELTPKKMGEFLEFISSGKITLQVAKSILPDLVRKPIDVSSILTERGILRNNDLQFLELIVRKIIDTNPEKAEAYRFGKTGLLKFFIGLVMKETKGQSDPQTVQKLVREKLEVKNDEF